MKKVKITKLEELKDALHPHNIAVGYEKEGVFNEEPVLGQRFYVGSFSTSGVQEILSPNTFRTYSSIYKWEYID